MANILHRITIDAAPDRVFDALTLSEGLQSWWTRDSSATPDNWKRGRLQIPPGDDCVPDAGRGTCSREKGCLVVSGRPSRMGGNPAHLGTGAY